MLFRGGRREDEALAGTDVVGEGVEGETGSEGSGVMLIPDVDMFMSITMAGPIIGPEYVKRDDSLLGGSSDV